MNDDILTIEISSDWANHKVGSSILTIVGKDDRITRKLKTMIEDPRTYQAIRLLGILEIELINLEETWKKNWCHCETCEAESLTVKEINLIKKLLEKSKSTELKCNNE